MRRRRKREELRRIAELLLKPESKNPYYLGDLAIRNLRELVENLDKFGEREREWIANWIEYLGDGETAEKIRQFPEEFKDILNARYNEVRRYVR